MWLEFIYLFIIAAIPNPWNCNYQSLSTLPTKSKTDNKSIALVSVAAGKLKTGYWGKEEYEFLDDRAKVVGGTPKGGRKKIPDWERRKRVGITPAGRWRPKPPRVTTKAGGQPTSDGRKAAIPKSHGSEKINRRLELLPRMHLGSLAPHFNVFKDLNLNF